MCIHMLHVELDIAYAIAIKNIQECDTCRKVKVFKIQCFFTFLEYIGDKILFWEGGKNPEEL